MSDYKRVFLLILIMTAVSGAIGIAAVGLLYHAAFEEERQRLSEIAKSQARLIEAIARFDAIYSKDYPKGPREATLSQIQDAHPVFEGFGKTGEFTLAERQADAIQFLLTFRHAGPDALKRIPLPSTLAEPMRRALAGHSGTLVGLDYRGAKVLAAHEPVSMLDLGIVAKIDLAEIREPFLRAGSIVGATALLLIGAGTFLFFRVSKPILLRIADSEQRFRSISTAAQDAIIMMDNHGKVSFWNKAAERLFGHKTHEATGQVLTDLIIPKRYHERHLTGAASFLRTGQGLLINRTVELEAQRKDGTEFPVEISVSGVHLGGEWNAVGILRDITDRKRAEEKLRQREELLRLILASTGEGIFGLDTHGRCTFANRACVDLLGYQDATQLRGKKMHPLIHHTHMDGTPYPAEECPTYGSYKWGRTSRVEGEVLWRADGSHFPAEYESYPLVKGTDTIGAVVTFTDITERKHAEEALRRERDFAESLVETAQCIVLVLDHKGRIVQFNRFLEELSGYRLKEVRGQDWFSTFVPEQDKKRRHQVFQEALADTPKIGEVNPIISRGGQQHLIQWYDKTLKNAAGQVIGVLAIGHDITEHKEQEAQLLQAQKMEVVGQLTGGIAHDFNNLLTIILGNLDLLSTELDNEAAPEIHELLEDAFTAAREAADLTQRLLALSRRRALKPNYIGLDQVVHTLKTFLRRILGEQFELRVNTPNDILTVFADPSQLENALLNLIINARDAMPRGGTLTIDIFRKTLTATDVASSDLLPGSYAVMKIADSGTGMPPDILSRAVEPFFTTKKSGKGTGLGLSMVYSFAKQSGGELRLKSTLGIGTSASLLLPEAEPLKESDTTAMDLARLPDGSGTILVVEDEPRVRKLLTRRLRNFGYRVIQSENAQSAKQIIESRTDVDLLFSDIVMPGQMDGYDLVRWAREQRPELKLLLTTGADSEQAVSQKKKENSHVVLLRKPFSETMLQETIRSLLSPH